MQSYVDLTNFLRVRIEIPFYSPRFISRTQVCTDLATCHDLEANDDGRIYEVHALVAEERNHPPAWLAVTVVARRTHCRRLLNSDADRTATCRMNEESPGVSAADQSE